MRILVLVALLATPLALAQSPTPAPPQYAAMIHILDGQFEDASRNGTVVPPGSLVAVMSFQNSDGSSAAHTLTADDGQSFDLDIPAPDSAAGYVYLNFTAPSIPGSYPYHSKVEGDRNMHGILIVTPARATPGSPEKQSPGATAIATALATAFATALVVRRRG